MSVIIKLTYGEMNMATSVACARRQSNVLKNIPPRYGAPTGEGSWEPDLMSCMGEVAVARYTNLFWSGTLNDFKAKDVGGILEVRTVTQINRCLLLHESDDDSSPFVMAYVAPPNVTLLGWILAADGKRQEFWKDKTGNVRPCFFVPQDELKPIESLLEWVNHKRINATLA